MNNKLFIEGYLNKTAEDSVGQIEDATKALRQQRAVTSSKLDTLLQDFYNNPRIKASKYVTPASLLLGAGIGTYAGHKYNPDDPYNSDLQKMLIGGTIGGLGGGFVGSALKDRLKWPVTKKLVEDLIEAHIEETDTSVTKSLKNTLRRFLGR